MCWLGLQLRQFLGWTWKFDPLNALIRIKITTLEDCEADFSSTDLSSERIVFKKNITNLYIWQWKTIVLHALHVHFSFWHFADVLVLSTTWNDLFYSCVDNVTIWWHMFNFVFLSLKRWLQFNSRIVRTHFASVMTLNNQEMIPETRSYIFRWRSRLCRCRVCANSLMSSPWLRQLQNQIQTNSHKRHKVCS